MPWPVLTTRLLASVLAAAACFGALFTGAAAATPDAARGSHRTDPNGLWAVQVVPTSSGGIDRSALKRLHRQGVNALVLDVQGLGGSTAAVHAFEAVRAFAGAEKMQLIAAVPPGQTSPIIWHTLSACRSHAAGLSCAVKATSVSAAKRLSHSADQLKPVVALFAAGPSSVAALGSLSSSRRPVLVVSTLRGSFDAPGWASAIRSAASSPHVGLGVAPITLTSPAVRRFGSTLAARGELAPVAAKKVAQLPRLWAVQVAPQKHGWFDRPLLKRTSKSLQLPTGGALYFDGGVLEVVTPVIEIAPQCTARVVRSLW